MKILFVDDDELILEMAKHALNNNGYTVTTAANGNEASELLNKDKYDLMICDIIMPEKEGLETISDAIKSNENMKIIAISAGGAISNTYFLEAAKMIGTHDTLKKPFTPDQLIEKVKKLEN